MNVEIVPVTLDSGSETLQAALKVYQSAWAGMSAISDTDLETMFARHSTYPGFLGLLARDRWTRQPVGLGYGHTDRPGQWWHNRVQPQLPEEYQDWLDDCFVVVELAVLPAFRRRGIGRQIMEQLLADRPEARAALSTEQDNRAARSLYTQLDFQSLIAAIQFSPQAPTYVVLGKSLRG